MPTRNARLPIAATLTLPCGCEVRDAAWYGRLILTGDAHCETAAAHVAELREAARAESAYGVDPPAEARPEVRRLQDIVQRALARLYDHVEAQRPKADDAGGGK